MTTNDMLVEEDDKEEESGDFEQIEDEGLKDSKDKDFEIIEEMKDSNKEYVLMSTVRGNFKGYTRHNIKKARKARRLQGMIGNPTEQEFAGMVHEKLIANYPVTVQDVHNANQIFAPVLANLRGKTTRTKLEDIRVDYAKILQDFVKMHKYVMLVADVMFVDLAIFGYLLKRNKLSYDRVFIITNCQTFSNYFRKSQESVRNSGVYHTSHSAGHGI